MKSHIASAIIVLCLLGCCTNLSAQDYLVSARMVTLFAPNPDIWVFHIDETKYPGYRAAESREQYQKRVDAFIETQRKSSKQLTGAQKQELVNFLLNNRSGSLYCIAGDTPSLGMDIKVNGDSATLLFGQALIYTFHKGKEIDGSLSKGLQQWLVDFKAQNKLE